MDAFFDRFARIPLLQKLLGMILIGLLVVVLFYFTLYSPRLDEIENLNNKIAEYDRSLEQKKKMVGDLSQYKREVEKLNQELQRALKLLPNRSEIPSLLQKISSLAKKSGLEILTFQPSPEIPQDFYAQVPVSLQLRGSYNEVVNFFDAVGKLSRIVNISNFSMGESDRNPRDTVSTKKVLNTSCKVTTFRFMSEVNDAGKAKKPAKKKKKKH